MQDLRSNERSWAIEVITEIVQYVNNRDYAVTYASGEKTLTTQTLFPDVILFGGKDRNILLQCWELKMPDVDIHEDDPYQKAINKAILLGLNSFVVWNVAEAELCFIDKDGTVSALKTYSIPEIHTRQDVERRKDLWIKTLHKIIDDVNELVATGKIEKQRPEMTIGPDLFDGFIKVYKGSVSTEINKSCKKDNVLEAQVTRWWNLNSYSYPNKSDKYDIISKIAIVRWINRFIYAHYLSSVSDTAKMVLKIGKTCTPVQTLDTFQEMSKSIDHYSIFTADPWDNHVGDDLWKDLLELNKYLAQIKISNLSSESLHHIIETIVDLSKRDLCGQYATPKPLAELLVAIAMKDKTKDVLDPCCGTGTIIRAAYDLKKASGVSDYVESTWANDKFAQQLSVCAVNLTDYDNKDKPNRLINKDLLDLEIGDKISLTSPLDGSKTDVELVPMGTVVSNLPFVEFEKIKIENPKAADLPLPGRSDLYMRLALYLDKFLLSDGRIGLIVSNSWLSVNETKFWKSLTSKYCITDVIISGNGRWFKNAKVVTTIIIGQKKQKDTKDSDVKFISTKLKIEDWIEENNLQSIVVDILTSEKSTGYVDIHTHSIDKINAYLDSGIALSAMFTNLSWLDAISDKTILVSSLYSVSRGSRPGANDFTYPGEDTSIEPEFLTPLIKDPKKTTKLIIRPDQWAFTCYESLDNLVNNNKKGALAWINRYKSDMKGGKTIQQRLRSLDGKEWYQVKYQSDNPDLLMMLNPDKRLSTFAVSTNKCIVDQRFIILTRKDNHTDNQLFHALMNSIFTMFSTESIGFGRGEGVLDLNSTNIEKRLRCLNPSLLNNEDQRKIIDAFQPILDRNILDLESELNSPDRIAFENVVFHAFGIKDYYDSVKQSLLGMYSIRKAAEK